MSFQKMKDNVQDIQWASIAPYLLAAGIIGLFVGAVVLAVAYQLFVAWVKEGTAGFGEANQPAAEAPAEA